MFHIFQNFRISEQEALMADSSLKVSHLTKELNMVPLKYPFWSNLLKNIDLQNFLEKLYFEGDQTSLLLKFLQN